MQAYADLLQKILDEGEDIGNERTGVGTRALFGEQLKFDLRKGFPAVTTKKLAFKSVTAEFLWFLKGSTNVNDLRAITHGEEHRFNMDKKTIWDANYLQQGEKELGYRNGYCGLVYGSQWRGFGLDIVRDLSTMEHIELPKVDQLAEAIHEAQVNPGSRRLCVEAWNPHTIWNFDDQGPGQNAEYVVNKPILPPCHTGFQFNIIDDYLDLSFRMRSVDVFLGMPFDIASYAELTHTLARILNKTPRYLVGQFGNTHIYNNHIEQVKEQLSRAEYDLPTLWIDPELKTLNDFENAKVDQFKLIGYEHHPAIAAPMAV